ncbi:glycine cleavage system H protein [Paenibacillus algorifonticola]|uniref:Glycine cleavage system H protein n=1 Tax=Paenibacillus algorifonticola TaxID=684063 RepID=A0A1I2D9P1_9BACL|nr:glycine cleavage system protein GcvH [Paenibacillus algorifonticola]SFE77257.1 glycine cleavage system H protein [Paenibacillus algorifonticola]
MSEIREQLRYSDEHEWVLQTEGSKVLVGITDHAQCQLGDIVFVEYPEVGAAVSAGDSIGTIESVKTVSELYSPVSGRITKVNSTLIDQPELINSEPYDGGWIVEVELEEGLEEALGKLLAAEAYAELIK